VRHAQGYHNLDKDGVDTEQIRDPDLTDRGREQCERLREDFPFQDKIDCILASPIRRTIQTALIGFQPAIEKRGLKLLLTPMAQETSDKPSDTGSELDKLQKEYGNRIDARRMTSDWNTNKGQWHMDWVSIEKHAVELRQYISGLDCENVVLVAHGGVSNACNLVVQFETDHLLVHALLHRRLVRQSRI